MGDDSPDWQRPIDIVRQSLDRLDIDITAQSVGDLDVNLNANSIGTLPISIEANSITGGVPIDIQTTSIGNLDVNLDTNSVGTLPISVEAQNIAGGIPIDIETQTAVLDINLQSSGVTLPIDVETQSLGSLDVDLSAQSLGTLGIDIEAQTISDVGIDLQTQSLNLVETAVETRRDIDLVEKSRVKSSSIADNSLEEENFTPPAGTIWEIQQVSFSVNGVGSSGSHIFTVSPSFGLVRDNLEYQFPAGTDINVPATIAESQGGATDVYPSTEIAQLDTVQSITVDEGSSLELSYFNAQGTSTSEQRTYALIAKQIEVA
jgi:hypothetical protein